MRCVLEKLRPCLATYFHTDHQIKTMLIKTDALYEKVHDVMYEKQKLRSACAVIAQSLMR